MYRDREKVLLHYTDLLVLSQSDFPKINIWICKKIVTFPTKKLFWLTFRVDYRMIICHVTGMMTIEVTPSHTRRHTRRHFAKSISTDGTEGKLTRNIQVTTGQLWDLYSIWSLTRSKRAPLWTFSVSHKKPMTQWGELTNIWFQKRKLNFGSL